MKYAVEVAHLSNGELVSVRRLSARRERVGSLLALGIVAAGFAVGMVFVLAVARLLGRAVYAPEFLGVWVGVGALAAVVSSVCVSRRLGRYVLGTRLDADGFAPFAIDLVRRRRAERGAKGTPKGFELAIVPGMQGVIDNGRIPLPVEALVEPGIRFIPLEEDVRAEIRIGASVFVVSGVGESQARPASPRECWRLFSRVALGGLELAMVGTLFSVVPRAETLGDRNLRAAGPRATTPWEAEKRLRLEAQEQAGSLHQCFDPLPLSCQHSGYVGVGVSLNRDGELRSNWISRSTYGRDCPVDECMKEVVSTWTFDPLPAAMRVVLPVQVLRTDKPLPPRVARDGVAMAGGVAMGEAKQEAGTRGAR